MNEYVTLKAEKRDGYDVCLTQKKIWNIEIDIAVKIINICEKYNLRVSIYAGSMLGAVRHKGFIPWDDDLDVALPREDYEKFLVVAGKELSYPYFLQTPLTDRKFFTSWARVRNSETTGIVKWNKSIEYNNGIYVDVYPLDGVSDSKIKLRTQAAKKDIIEQIIKSYYADATALTRRPQFLTDFLKFIGHRKSYEYWLEKYKKVVSKYNNSTTKIAIIVQDYKVISKYWSYLVDFNDIVYVPFESIQVPILKNYDLTLKNMYGNYMEFPPVESRGEWHGDMIIFDPDTPYKEYIRRMNNNEEN